MSFVVTFDQADSATSNEATQIRSSRSTANAQSFGEPSPREAEAMPPFEQGVAKKVRVDGAVDDVETQVGHGEIVELFPHVYRVR